MRMTHQMVGKQMIETLMQRESQIADLQQSMTSGKRLRRPSDDPVGSVNSLRQRSLRRQNAQMTANAESAKSWLQATEAGLSHAVDLAQRLRELTVQAAHEPLPQDSREALAAEVEQIRQGLGDVYNSQQGRDYLFNGQAVRTAPFDGGVTAAGYAPIVRDIAPGVGMELTVDVRDAFAGLIEEAALVVDGLTAGDVAGMDDRLNAIDLHLGQVIETQAVVGARLNRVDLSLQQLGQEDIRLRGRISDVEDADLTRLVMQWSTEQAGYQAALGAGAQLIQSTLVDYLA